MSSEDVKKSRNKRIENNLKRVEYWLVNNKEAKKLALEYIQSLNDKYNCKHFKGE